MQELQTQIRSEANKLWIPLVGTSFVPILNNTWFDVCESANRDAKAKIPKESATCETIHCKKIRVHLDDQQKKIMMRWMFSYIHMFNATLDILKVHKETLNWKTLRTKHLKQIKSQIIATSPICDDPKTKVIAHALDGAIKLACANYKTAIANLRSGVIKHFRIRKWRFNRQQLVIDLEPQYFRNGTLCKRVFGKISFTYNGKLFDVGSISSECKMIYDRLYDQFTLLVPETIEPTKHTHPHEKIALDPGLRTFMTGISEEKVVEIGKLSGKRIGHLLTVIDHTKKTIRSLKKRDKIEQRCRRKIKGLVDELHWKTAKYLTDNFSRILIGDLSAKGISSNTIMHGISDMNKRLAYALSFYKFRERLQFKCKQRGCEYVLVDEHFTSKLCSKCGHCKDDLGSAKIYNCDECHVCILRDVNGARNIFMKVQ